MSTIGQLLREARRIKALSMRAAAQDIGVGVLTYRMWEADAWRPAHDNWTRIAEWAGVPTPIVLGALGVLTEEQVKTLVSSEQGV